jgi:hypothetical protein
MGSSVSIAAGKANLAPTKTGGIAPVVRGLQSLTSEFLKRNFPEDTYALIARLMGLRTKKTAENRITGARGFNENEVASLICSELGARYITALMDAIPEEQWPDWYRIHRPLMELADAEKLIAAARSKTAKAIRRTVDADDQVSAAIRRAQALSVQDPEFHSGTLAALGAIAGVFHRPMAAPARKGRVK